MIENDIYYRKKNHKCDIYSNKRNMRPNKSALANGSKSYSHLTVRFNEAEDEKDEIDQNLQQTFLHRQIRSWSYFVDQSSINNHDKYHHTKLTWRCLFGTMFYLHQKLNNSRRLFLFIFLDSCFRGIGQVVFANNPLSGIVS